MTVSRILKSKQSTLYLFALAYAMLVLTTSQYVFFWDTVQLGSKHAHFYFETSFTQLFLPNDIDSGHIPVFGMYLATVWLVFSKSLLASHLAMLPFVLGIVWQANKLLSSVLPVKLVPVALAVTLADPTLLAQCTLISPDVPLVFFFLLGLNSIRSDQRIYLSLAILGLFLTSMRGMMVAFALLLFDLYFNFFKAVIQRNFARLIRMSVPYLPGFVIFLIYTILHSQHAGWVGYHSDSPWSTEFDAVDITGVLRNLGLLGWRLLDFGRIFIWIPFVAIAYRMYTSKVITESTRTLAIALLMTLGALTIMTVWFANLIAHRYFMPAYLLFAVLTLKMMSEYLDTRRFRLIAAILTLGLLSGNFWVYPDKIAMGWDSSLAYLPYNDLRSHAIDYLDSRNIPLEDVGTAFPIKGALKYHDLSDRQSILPEKSPGQYSYLLYSNISNDFTDDEIDQLNELEEIWRGERHTVKMILYKTTK